MNTQLKKNMLWNALGNIVYLGCQWLVTVLVTRLAGYEDAGVLSLAMSISATFQSLALFGIRNYQISDINEKYSDSCYVGLRNLTCVSALVLCMLFSIANDYDTDTLMAILCFMVFRVSENYSDVLHGILQKNGKLYMAGQSFLIRGIATLVGFLIGFYFFGTLNGELATMAVLSVCVTVFIDFICAKKTSEFVAYDHIGKCFNLAAETLPLCIYIFLNSTIATVPKYILEKMSSEELLGIYSSIFAPALLVQAAAQYIYMPFIPKFAAMYNEGDIKGFKSLSNKIVLIILGIGILILAACIPFGKWALTLLFTESIEPYSGMLYLIIAGTFCTAISAFYQSLAVVLRVMRELVVSCISGIIVCCIVSVAAIDRFSADGASIGLIAGTLLTAVILYICINQRLETEEII